MAQRLCIDHLRSGGIITNYRCPSRCAHCLYACGPQRSGDYIDMQTARESFETVKALGCRSVHIGGGEPFLDIEGLRAVLAAARAARVAVAYVETNSAWFRDPATAQAILRDLKSLGLTMLLISISPFHNEFIPFNRVKGVIAACRAEGLAAFPWINDFYREIDALDGARPHALAEYEACYGPDYLARIPDRYWIHLGGRALETFAAVLPTLDATAILSANPRGCAELADVSHFHLDLYGNYVPGLCAGLAIRRKDLGRPLDAEQYPLISMLYTRGINGFYALASQEHGFTPGERYLSKCHLCFDIRRHLALDAQQNSPELQPEAMYRMAPGTPEAASGSNHRND